MKILANLGLAALFVLALAAVGTAAVWKFAPQYIQTADEKWAGHHTGTVRRAIVGFREQSKTDPGGAIAGLGDLADSLTGYEKADRRYPLRRQALRLLADLHFNQKQLEQAEAVGSTLVGLDSNDIGTRLWFGQRLCDHRPTLERGLEELRQLFDMLPEAGVVARTYIRCLTAADQPERAGEALMKHATRMLRPEQALEQVAGVWQLWWSADGRFAKEQRIDMTPVRYGDITALGFELPEKAAFVRLDPPASCRFAYSNPRWGLTVDGGQVEVPLPVGDIKLNDMYIDKDALYTTGGRDPWFSMPVPAEYQATPMKGRFVLKADRLPLWIGAAAGTPAAQNMIEDLGSGSKVGSALALAHARFIEVTEKMSQGNGDGPR